jgi:hypothetical protein
MNATWGVVLFTTAVDEQHSQDVECGNIFRTRVIYRVHSLLISGAVKEICPANTTKLGHITTIGKSYQAKSTSPSCWLSFAYSYGRYLLQISI